MTSKNQCRHGFKPFSFIPHPTNGLLTIEAQRCPCGVMRRRLVTKTRNTINPRSKWQHHDPRQPGGWK